MKGLIALILAPILTLYLFLLKLWYCEYVVNYLEVNGIETFMTRSRLIAAILVYGAIKANLTYKPSEQIEFNLEYWFNAVFVPAATLPIAILGLRLIGLFIF